MTPTRLTEALQWLGPLTIPELARVLNLSQRHVRRYVVAAGYGFDEERRVNLAVRRTNHPRAAMRAVFALLGDDDGEVYADWICERTGYGRRAVYAALRDLGYVSRRGRGAVWHRAMMAAK